MALRTGLIAGFGAICLFSSCLKEEIPVPGRSSGKVTTQSVDMKSDYRYRLFYDFETGAVVGQQMKASWDLGFSCGEGQWIVRLNSSKSMKACFVQESNLSAINDTSGSNDWRWEAASGDDDSLAIGDVRDLEGAVIIDAGYNERGYPQGLFKVLFKSVQAGSYVFEWAELHGGEIHTFEIKKDSLVNQLLFSFQNKTFAAEQEPPKAAWDLVFTQYTQMVDNTPYLVTGALINPYRTLAFHDSLLNFASVTRETALELPLTDRQDIPGFNWKTYDFDTGSYVIRSEKCYVFQSQEGYFWKMRFIDFYNDSGQSGYPTFELQRL